MFKPSQIRRKKTGWREELMTPQEQEEKETEAEDTFPGDSPSISFLSLVHPQLYYQARELKVPSESQNVHKLQKSRPRTCPHPDRLQGRGGEAPVQVQMACVPQGEKRRAVKEKG